MQLLFPISSQAEHIPLTSVLPTTVYRVHDTYIMSESRKLWRDESITD